VKPIILYSVVLFILVFTMGFLCSELYRDYTNQRNLDGLWLRNYNETEVDEEVIRQDDLGDWVCVNINGMSFERALEVCRHEVFHEIWAECGEHDSLSNCISKYEEEMNKNVTI